MSVVPLFANVAQGPHFALHGRQDPSANLSWIGVLGALTLAALPHWYTIYLAESNKVQGGWSNVNPRFWVQQLIAKSATLQTVRARAVHPSRSELARPMHSKTLPLFAATLIWANYTALPLATINNFVIAYLASRALYTVLYLNTTSKSTASPGPSHSTFGILHNALPLDPCGLNISPKPQVNPPPLPSHNLDTHAVTKGESTDIPSRDHSFEANRARSTFFCTLPVLVFGSSSTMSNHSGTAKPDMRSLQCF
ncbi:hypothetical protein L1887_58571 [Cichorium endivia]|nr:hypothetical protein L1887_58571 [Cichorium endivia]